MSRAKLIQLIHVARREAGLDDETYQAKLQAATGKRSCRDMTLLELETALGAFRDSGFKRKTKRASERQRSAIVGKIRAVWTEMHAAGFIKCDSEAALDRYVARMTAKLNGGDGVAKAAWLTDALASKVLESLKKWHKREIIEAIARIRDRLKISAGDKAPQWYVMLGINEPLIQGYEPLKRLFNDLQIQFRGSL